MPTPNCMGITRVNSFLKLVSFSRSLPSQSYCCLVFMASLRSYRIRPPVSKKSVFSMAQHFQLWGKTVRFLLLLFWHYSVDCTFLQQSFLQPFALWSFILPSGELLRCIIMSAHSTAGDSQLTPFGIFLLFSAVCLWRKAQEASGWQMHAHTHATGHLLLVKAHHLPITTATKGFSDRNAVFIYK